MPISNCSSESRMYEWRQMLCGKIPAASTGGARSRSSTTTSGRIGNRQANRSRVRVVLGDAGDLDDAEERLPHRRVQDRQLPGLDGGPSRRPVHRDRVPADSRSSGRSPRPRTSSQRVEPVPGTGPESATSRANRCQSPVFAAATDLAGAAHERQTSSVSRIGPSPANRRLRRPPPHETTRKEGAHGGSRGSPVKRREASA